MLHFVAASIDLLDDLFGPSSTASASSGMPSFNAPKTTLPQVLSADKNEGVAIHANLKRTKGSFALQFEFVNNSSSQSAAEYAVQFNKNSFGFIPLSSTLSLGSPVAPGTVRSASLPVNVSTDHIVAGRPTLDLPVALKNSKIQFDAQQKNC